MLEKRKKGKKKKENMEMFEVVAGEPIPKLLLVDVVKQESEGV